ncbi:hypothetical protein V5799_033554, partial [Amblyomma americanum]
LELSFCVAFLFCLPQPPPRGPPPPLGAPRGPPLIPDHRGPPPVSNEWERPPAGMHSLPPVSQPPPHPGGVPPGPAPPGMPPNRLPPPVVPATNVPPPAPHVNPAFFPQHAGLPPPPTSSQPSDPYGRPPPTQYTHDYRGPANDSLPYSVDPRSMLPASSSIPSRQDPLNPPINEAEFEEIMSRNRTVSSSAIARAVADASAGEFASAIETLVTAISLIKQSKVANDDRCKILISSLQDTLHGIESKSYSSRSKDRPRSRERDRSRERSSRREKSSRRDRRGSTVVATETVSKKVQLRTALSLIGVCAGAAASLAAALFFYSPSSHTHSIALFLVLAVSVSHVLLNGEKKNVHSSWTWWCFYCTKSHSKSSDVFFIAQTMIMDLVE